MPAPLAPIPFLLLKYIFLFKKIYILIIRAMPAFLAHSCVPTFLNSSRTLTDVGAAAAENLKSKISSSKL